MGKPIKHMIDFSTIAFSPDGRTVITMTDNWVHQSTISSDNINPKASRLLPGSGIGPYAIPNTGTYRFLDAKGDKMQVAVCVTGDTIKIVTVRFDIPDAPPIAGDPEELMEEWQKRIMESSIGKSYLYRKI